MSPQNNDPLEIFFDDLLIEAEEQARLDEIETMLNEIDKRLEVLETKFNEAYGS